MSYRDLFDQAVGDAPPSGVDVDGVVRRQRRAARIRPVLATLVAVLVAGAGAGTAIRLTAGDEDEGPPVPVPAGELAGFPAFVDGAVVLAAEQASLADRTLSLTFTRTFGDERLITRCAGPTGAPPAEPEGGTFGGALFAEVSWQTPSGGYSREALYCPGPELPWDEWDGPQPWSAGGYHWGEFWDAHGVPIGQPVTITITLTGFWPLHGDGEMPVPSDGTFGLAVARAVQFEHYPLPPRPATLEPLSEGSSTDFELRADPLNPGRPVRGTVEWDPAWCEPGDFPLNLASQSPGTMEVQINDGGVVVHHSWWDYEQDEPVFDLSAACGGPAGVNPGDEVTITVRTEHMTGDWVVRISRAGG